MRVQVEGWKS